MREREGRVLEGKSDVCWKEENGSAEILKGIGEGIDLCVLHVDEKKNARVALDGDGERVDGVFEGGGVDLRFFQQENGGCDVGDHRNALQIAENKGKVLRVESSARKRRREKGTARENAAARDDRRRESESLWGEKGLVEEKWVVWVEKDEKRKKKKKKKDECVGKKMVEEDEKRIGGWIGGWPRGN